MRALACVGLAVVGLLAVQTAHAQPRPVHALYPHDFRTRGLPWDPRQPIASRQDGVASVWEAVPEVVSGCDRDNTARQFLGLAFVARTTSMTIAVAAFVRAARAAGDIVIPVPAYDERTPPFSNLFVIQAGMPAEGVVAILECYLGPRRNADEQAIIDTYLSGKSP